MSQAPNPKMHFLFLSLKKTRQKCISFGDLVDWPSSICGWQVIAKKHILLAKIQILRFLCA